MKYSGRFQVQVKRGRLWVTVWATDHSDRADDERIRWIDSGYESRVIDRGAQLSLVAL